jgi:hypothetical protein
LTCLLTQKTAQKGGFFTSWLALQRYQPNSYHVLGSGVTVGVGVGATEPEVPPPQALIAPSKAIAASMMHTVFFIAYLHKKNKAKLP